MSIPTPSPWQSSLFQLCQIQGWRPPQVMLFSDRRGGRTAYSAQINVGGRVFASRFWYSGPNTNNAQEDAAEVAYKSLNPGAAQ